jgi:hypothetical protein
MNQYRGYVESKIRLCEAVLAQADDHPEWGWTTKTRRNWQAKLVRWQRKLQAVAEAELTALIKQRGLVAAGRHFRDEQAAQPTLTGTIIVGLLDDCQNPDGFLHRWLKR